MQARLPPRLLVSLVAISSSSWAAPQARQTFDGKTAYFGSLHSHSVLSGDVSDSDGLSPAATYQAAMDAGLDFLGISDHHKGISNVHTPPKVLGGARFQLSATAYQGLLDDATAFNTANAGSFVAFAGFEWGTIGTGNHINIFGADSLPPSDIDDDDYKDLYTWIANNASFAQFNHPYAWQSKPKAKRRNDVGNFGENLFTTTEDFVGVADTVELMSIICTVKGGHKSGEHRHSTAKTHRDSAKKAMPRYKEYLNAGFHLSPAANQDTHGKNPGSVTAARTGVWADAFTEDGILEAIQANRVFATEDDELAVALQVALPNGDTFWMGETVTLSGAKEDVTLIIHVGQADGSDGDATTEGPYLVTLFRDPTGAGKARVKSAFKFPVASAGDWEIGVTVKRGEYLYVQVTEQGGSDNPVGEGRPGNMNDDAWTSPIWFAK